MDLALSLIEDYISQGLTVSAASILDEASVGQIRKQKPWYVPMIDHLRKKEKVPDKYIPWMVAVLDREYKTTLVDKSTQDAAAKSPGFWDRHWDSMFRTSEFKREGVYDTFNLPSTLRTMIDLAKRYEKASKAKKWDKALKMGLLKNQRVKDIMFWSKPGAGTLISKEKNPLHSLYYTLDRIETLQSRKDIKVQGADKIYRDERFTVYSPQTTRASCQLGAGTKWCIAGRNNRYFDDYVEQGMQFAFIMDSSKDVKDDYHKIAVVYSLMDQDFIEFYNAPDDSVAEHRVEDAIGSGNWIKIKRKIEYYMSDKEVPLVRAEGDYWAGDEVTFDDRNNDASSSNAYNDTDLLLSPYEFSEVGRDTLEDEDLRRTVYDALYNIYYGAEGIVTGPTRTNIRGDYPIVTVEGTYGKDDTDWDEVLDEYFPIPPKPVNPVTRETGKEQLFLPAMQKTAKQVADAYQEEMDDWRQAIDTREEFKDRVVDDIERMSGGNWYESELYVGDLVVTNKIDPEESVRKYGPV